MSDPTAERPVVHSYPGERRNAGQEVIKFYLSSNQSLQPGRQREP